jgi:hypothetical protein
MARRFFALMTAVLVLAGCSTVVELPAVSEQHPANPNAAAAPLPALSDVLRVEQPVAPPPKPAPMRGMPGMENMPGMEGMEGTP